MVQTLEAQEQFRAAYENRYIWDENFPGYRADVTLMTEGETHKGQVLVNSDLSFEVLDMENEQAKRTVHNQLWEITIHRVNHSFEKTHGQNTFTLGSVDETGAVEILVGGASAGNRYKLRDNTVCFVHRHIGNKVVNINTYSTLMTNQGYLSQEYDSVYINPETGKPQGTKTTFKDSFAQVGDYYILTNRLISTEEDGNSATTTQLEYSNIELL